MDRADQAQLDAVTEVVTAALGDSVTAAYLYGSALMGGMRHRSDIDVLAVTARPSTEPERLALVTGLMAVSGEAGGSGPRPVEVTVVRLSAVKPWRRNPEREFQYGEWLRGDYERGFIPAPTVDPDLAPLLATVLTAARPLVGPPADELLEPVPVGDLVAAIVEALPALAAELGSDTTNVLLTLARMWHTREHGTIVSKDAAAEWALARMPGDVGDPLAHARADYLGEQDAAYGSSAAVKATASYLYKMIER